MVDVNSQFFALLTKVGRAKQANADALGLPWKITEMGVGDANDTDPIPSESQTRLINEWRRRPLNQLRVDPVNPAVIIAEQIIPADEGGRWIREIGLYDADGDLVAVANCAPSFKPVLSQGSGRTQVVRMNFIVSSTGNITLKIDPAVVLATREYVDSRILEELYKLDSKQSVRVATTGNIALAGLQTLDGVTLLAGDRVLVKNQAVAKDNGIYITAAPAWKRAEDADTNAEVTSALLVSVEQGTTQADTTWQLVTDGVIVLGTTALTFQNVTQGFAPINSPALLGAPTAPTPPLFDDSKSLATTEFVRRGQGNYSGLIGLSAATTLTTAAVGNLVSLIGTFTVTLPAANTLPSGGAINFRNVGAGNITVACAGDDIINAGANQVLMKSIVLVPGATLELTSAAGNGWWASGSAQLQYASILGTTPPRFDNTKKIVTTEWARSRGVEYGGVYIVTAALAGIAAHVGGMIHAYGSGPTSYSLPDSVANGILPGSTIRLQNWSLASLSLVAQGADKMQESLNIPPSSSLRSIPPDTYVDITCIGNGNWLLLGTGVVAKTAPFSALFGTTGYSKEPNGGIEMWGMTGGAVPGAVMPITFPFAFPNVCWNIQMTYVDSGMQQPASRGGPVQVGNYSNAGFNYSHSGSSSSAQHFWRAKGN